MKSILKKVLGIALTASLALGMISCSDGSSDDSSSGSANVDYSACAVGDFILKDGSVLSKDSTPASGNVAAVIVRAAADGKPALGVGIVYSTSGLKWCESSADGYSNIIENLKTSEHAEGDGLSKLKAACSDANASLANYPAWNYCSTYGSTNGFTGTLASGWYLPTIDELKTICKNGAIVKESLSKIGETAFYNYYYFSCNQNSNDSYSTMAATYFLAGDTSSTSYKEKTDRAVCAVRAFN